MNQIIVVYYSRTGRTRLVAEKLAAAMGADLEELRETKDRSGALGWLAAGRDAVFNRPTQLETQPSLAGRKLLVLGMPVWGGSPPPAVRQYLGTVETTGVKTAGFCTHDGGGGKGTFAKLAEMLPGGLIDSLELKKPRQGDAALDQQLTDWAARVRAAAGV